MTRIRIGLAGLLAAILFCFACRLARDVAADHYIRRDIEVTASAPSCCVLGHSAPLGRANVAISAA